MATQSENNEVIKDISYNLENLGEGIAKDEQSKESDDNLLFSLSEILQTRIDNMLLEVKTQLTNVIEQQEETIQRQNQTNSRFQEDLLYKIQKPLIMDIIGIADNIRMMLQDQEKERNYESLLESVKSLESWVDATLSNNSVRRFRETENSISELNRKRQEVIDVEDTDDPNKHNTYICERPGYIWTMPYLFVNSEIQLKKILQENAQPQLFSFVIRPEEVIKLKYREE